MNNTYDYSAIWNEIADSVESGLTDRLSKIDFEGIIKKALSRYNLKLDDIDWDSKSFQLALSKGLFEALNGVKKEVKTELGEFDIGNYMKLNEKSLNIKIKSAFENMIKVSKEYGKEAAQEFTDEFFQAMTVAKTRKFKFPDQFKESWEDAYDDLMNELRVGLGGKDSGEYKIGSDLEAKFTKASQTYQEWYIAIQDKIKDYRATTEIAKNVVNTIRQSLPKNATENQIRDVINGLLESSGVSVAKTQESLKEMSKTVESLGDAAADQHIADAYKNLFDEIKKVGDVAGLDTTNAKLRESLEELKLINKETESLKLVNQGHTNEGGIIGEDTVVLLRNNTEESLQNSQMLMTKLDEAYKKGVNVSRIIDVINDGSRVFMEIQEKMSGETLGNGVDFINWDFLDATEEQINRFAEDIKKLQELGIGVDINMSNIFYDKEKGFGFIDLDLKPAMYQGVEDFLDDFRGGVVGEIEAECEEMNKDLEKIPFAQGFYDKFAESFNKATDSHSPSEKTRQAADNVINGVVEELTDRTDDIEKAGEEAGKAAIQGMVKGFSEELSEYEKMVGEWINSNVDLSTAPFSLINNSDEAISQITEFRDELQRLKGEADFSSVDKKMQTSINNDIKLLDQLLESAKPAVVTHTLVNDDDIDAYLAQMDSKVISNLDLSIKEATEDMSDLGEEMSKVNAQPFAEKVIDDLKEVQKETNKALELFKESKGMNISEMLDAGWWATPEEAAAELGEKYQKLLYDNNDKRSVWNETLLNQEYFRDILPYLDLTAEQLDVIKTELYAIDKYKPGGDWERLSTTQSPYLDGGKKIDNITAIVTGKRDVTDDELKDAKGLAKAMQEVGTELDNLGREIKSTSQQVVTETEVVQEESKALETLADKFEYLKKIKAESKFMEDAEDKKMDMEEKAWDVGGNNPKSEAESQKRIQKYEELCDHIKEANHALDEFNETYEEVIISLKNGEQIKVFDAYDLDNIRLAKQSIKDIQFIRQDETPVSNEAIIAEQQLTIETEKANTVIEEQKQKITELEAKQEELYNDIAARENALLHTVDEDDYDAAVTDLETQKTITQELQKQNKELQERNDLLKEESDSYRSEADSLQTELNRSLGSAGYLDEELHKQKQITEELQQQNAELKEQSEERQKQIDAMHEEMEEDQRFYTFVDEELGRQKELNDTLEASVEAERRARKEAEGRASFYEDMSNIAAREEARAKERADQEFEAREEAEKTLKETEKQAKALQEQNEALSTSLALAKQVANEYQEQFDKMKSLKSTTGKSDKSVEKEAKGFDHLRESVESVTKATNEKTEAFKNEGFVVKGVVGDEVNVVGQLKGAVDDVKTVNKAKQTKKTKQAKDENAANVKQAVQYYNRLIKNERQFQSLAAKRGIGIELSKTESKTLSNLQEQRETENEILNIVKERTKELEKARTTYEETRLLAQQEAQVLLGKELRTSITNVRDKLQSKIDSGRYSPESVGVVQQSLDALSQKNYFNETNTQKLKEYLDTLKGIDTQFEKIGNETKLTKLLGDVSSTLADNTKMSKDLRGQFDSLNASLQEALNTGASQEQVRALTNRFLELKNEMIKTGQTGRSFFGMIKNDISQASARMIAQYMSFQDFIRYIRAAASAVTDLNSALNQLRIVSGESEASVNRVGREAYELANNLGMSTTEVVSSITEWRRLGKTIDESMILAEQAARLSTGGMMDISSATTALVSSMQAFEMKAEDINKVVDQYIYLGK